MRDPKDESGLNRTIKQQHTELDMQHYEHGVCPEKNTNLRVGE